MRRSVVIGVGVVGLIGLGLWLGRSSSSEVARAEPREESTSVVSRVASAAPHAVGRAPSLARHPDIVPGLAADLIAADPKIRRAAVVEVAGSSDPDPKVMLIAARDSDPGVGGTAMVALGKLYASGQVTTAELAERATDHQLDQRVRAVGLNALGVVASSEGARILIKLLETGDVLERRSAAALLGNQELALAIPALIRALGDPDEYVRGNAVESLKLRSRGRDFGADAAGWQAWWQSQSR